MTIYQCDICNQTVDKDVVHVRYRYNFGGAQICLTCAEPIKKFLKNTLYWKKVVGNHCELGLGDYDMNMSLTKDDLKAIKALIDESIDESVPSMLDKLEKKLTGKIDNKIDGLTLQIGQFSLETTNNFNDLRIKIDANNRKQDEDIKKVRKALHAA